MKEALRGQQFFTNEDVKTAVRSWLRPQPSSFYNKARIQAVIKRWTAAADNGGDYVEK